MYDWLKIVQDFKYGTVIYGAGILAKLTYRILQKNNTADKVYGFCVTKIENRLSSTSFSN